MNTHLLCAFHHFSSRNNSKDTSATCQQVAEADVSRADPSQESSAMKDLRSSESS